MSPVTEAPGRSAPGPARLAWIRLDGEALTRLSPLLEADRAQAVADLQAVNEFAPCLPSSGESLPPAAGPFGLRLSIAEGRLAFDIRDAGDAPLRIVLLALGPFRGLIRDYQMIVDSYGEAVAEGRADRIQAIDMGRRGVHDEGAQLMIARLAGKIGIDFATARRIFTLVCVLHQRD